MGMFDTIKCERELPGNPRPSAMAWLQSQDLERGCETYTITADGSLAGPDGDVNFDGILNFYTIENDYWFEYGARFREGRLQGIDVLKHCPVGSDFYERLEAQVNAE